MAHGRLAVLRRAQLGDAQGDNSPDRLAQLRGDLIVGDPEIDPPCASSSASSHRER